MRTALFLLLLVTSATGASALYEPELVTEPLLPRSDQPLRLHFTTWCVTAPEPNPRLLRDGNLLRVAVDPGGCILSWPPPQNSPFHVDAGLLAAGHYTVELGFLDDLDGEFYPKASFPLEVAAAEFSEFIEPLLPLDTGTTRLIFPLHADPFKQNTRALVRRAGNTIAVTFGLTDCHFPCVPLPSVVTADLGVLPAGDYTVEVWQIPPAPAPDQPALARSFPLVVAEGPARVRQGRFELEVGWRTAAGEEGRGHLVQAPSEDSALFYFFDRANWELMVKVLDGCAINGHYWVFAAASTDVEFGVVVEELATGRKVTFGNPLGLPASAVANITAFSCS